MKEFFRSVMLFFLILHSVGRGAFGGIHEKPQMLLFRWLCKTLREELEHEYYAVREGR